jgi:hypothetical protein
MGEIQCVVDVTECVQTVNPASETCNALDDDCNGVVDDPGVVDGDSCDTGLDGVCAAGETLCSGGALSCEQTVSPDTEQCNSADDDCNGVVDDPDAVNGNACDTGVPGICAPGETLCTAGVETCEQTVMPGSETCNDADDDCNGVVDDPGVVDGDSCDTGLDGVCAAGETLCSGGTLNCEQTVFPDIEQCNSADDDCNGVVDDPDAVNGNACDTGVPGICAPGETLCTAGVETCEQTVMPGSETCNALDDDCNGVVDDPGVVDGDSCDTGLDGVCAAGETLCSGGTLSCEQTVFPGLELCNSADDDCNGVVDDPDAVNGNVCDTGVPGICAPGETLCTAGVETCEQTVMPGLESCNAADDDCNGVVDDPGVVDGDPCDTGLDGICAAGETLCSGGTLSCEQTVFPDPEVCNNADDDCNGVVDDPDAVNGNACDTGLDGICAPGETLCTGGTESCEQTVFPGTETCNDIDDDCDGTVDDPSELNGRVCDTGLDGVCQPGATLCSGGTLTCEQTVLPGTEICNTLDDDCDGVVDDPGELNGNACDTGLDGICAPGETLCSGGTLTCEQTVFPGTEICNDADDDCDGVVDDPAELNGNACDTGLDGICADGTTLCSAGGVASCEQTFSPAPESCDGLDEDCDGTADNESSGATADDNAMIMCERTCGGPIPNVNRISCNSGTCELTAADCPVGRSDADGNPCNGCENLVCSGSTAATVCASAGTISTSATINGALLEEGDAIYYRLPIPRPGTTSYTTAMPRVRLTGGATYYRMDVLQDCSNYITCPSPGGSGTSNAGDNITDWYIHYDQYQTTCKSYGNCTNNTNSGNVPAAVYIRITRDNVPSGTWDCQGFTIVTST